MGCLWIEEVSRWWGVSGLRRCLGEKVSLDWGGVWVKRCLLAGRCLGEVVSVGYWSVSSCKPQVFANRTEKRAIPLVCIEYIVELRVQYILYTDYIPGPCYIRQTCWEHGNKRFPEPAKNERKGEKDIKKREKDIKKKKGEKHVKKEKWRKIYKKKNENIRGRKL